jgi:hypothetical protein
MATLLNSPIRLGTASSRTEHYADLGKLIFVDGNGYRLVRAPVAISSAANSVVIHPNITGAVIGGPSGAGTAVTISASGGAAGQAVITTAATTGVTVGQYISGAGIPTVPGGVYVVAVVASTSVTISANLTATATGTYTFTTGVQHMVTTTTTAAATTPAGVIVPGQVGSTGSTSILAGDFFFLQVSGLAFPRITATAVAAGTGLTTHTTSGECAAVSATYAATTQGALVGYTLMTGSGSASQPTATQLVGLI